MEETVDILLATHNIEENYLRKQVESIINQTYKNIQIIISDDASTDKKVIEIIKEYEQKDSRIKVYEHEQNLGFNANFEFLLKQSTSEYIMFSDHDDIWHKNKVEESLKKIKETKASMAYCNLIQIDQNDKIVHKDYFKYKNMPIVNGKSKLAISRCVGLGCTQIITKSVKEKMIPFKKETIAHDWLAAFIANEENGIACIEEPLIDYRIHTGNVFGGRSLGQNLQRWKDKNGTNYTAFKKYRQDAIDRAYLGGAKMCLCYSENEDNKKFLKKLIKYYEKVKETKIINFHIIAYFKFLGGRNLFKKMMKEIVIFHFPLIGFLVYKIF